MLERLVQLVMQQRVLILVLAVVLAAAGIYSWQKLELDAFPDVSNVQVMILTEAPGLAAIDVERQITFPIEWQMGGLPHVRMVRSLSKPGLSQVVVVFEDFVDTYFTRQVVLERLQLAREDLPEGVDPELGPISTGLGEIYQYTVEGETKSAMELRTIQDWLIAPQLRTLSGVTEVNSFGGFVKQYHVQVHPQKLLKFGITLNDVIEAVEKNNANAGGNFILKGWEQSYVRGIGLFSGISDIEKIVLKAKDGTPVLLRDLAEVMLGAQTRQGVVTRDGKGEAVCGMVVMLKGSNSREVVDRVKRKVARIQESLPEDVTIDTFYDRTFLIEKCVNTMTKALLVGAILVFAVLFGFLWSLRAGLIVSLSLPLSALITLTLMKWQGLTANLMSLGGLAISIGMIVDGSIVVTENIVRLLSEKRTPNPGIVAIVAEATKEVIRPVLFAMLIIIVVFFPLFTLEQTEGKMFKPLATTICLAMFGSLVVALVIVPVLCSFVLGSSKKEGRNPVVQALAKVYKPILTAALRHRVFVVLASLVLFAASLLLLSRLGTEFMPQLDEGSLAINIIRLPSASLEGAREVSGHIERCVLQLPEVETVVSKSGRAEISEDPMGPDQSDVFVMLKPRSQWRSGVTKQMLVDDIRKELKRIPGLRAGFSQPIALRVNELISGIKSDLAIKLFGEDLEILREKAAEISGVLSGIEGARGLKVEQIAGFSQINVEIDREAIARHKINVADINDVIETAVGGKVPTWVVEGRRRFAVLVRFPPEQRENIEDLAKILVPSPEGYHVPLVNLARIGEEEGPAQVSHENNMRRIVVECNIRGRDVGGFVEEAQRKLEPVENSLPPGYFMEFGGQFENQERAQKRLTLIVPLCLVIIFFLLAASFGSARAALLVILNVPFALIGGIFSLYVTGQYLSVPSSIGFIALLGIAVLNGVVLVAYIRQLRKRGLSQQEAVVQAALQRMRPVLMTSLTTVGGLVPLLLATGIGSEVQRPLATVVVGGLATSTALTLLVLPCLYSLFEGRPNSRKTNSELGDSREVPVDLSKGIAPCGGR